MRKILLWLLCLLLAAVPALGEEAVWSLEDISDVIRPGKAVLLVFTAPGEEAVDILVDLIENHSKNRHVVLSTAVRLGGSVAHFSSAN